VGRRTRIITPHLALAPGTRIGVYDGTAQIGDVVMGQVYRRDRHEVEASGRDQDSAPSLAADGAQTKPKALLQTGEAIHMPTFRQTGAGSYLRHQQRAVSAEESTGAEAPTCSRTQDQDFRSR
jgi:hypothetical protein